MAKSRTSKVKKDFCCDTCEKCFRSRSLLMHHQFVVHPKLDDGIFKCEKCNKVFQSARSLVIHVQRHEQDNTNNKEFICDTCEKCFNSGTQLMHHQFVEHPTRVDGVFQCEKCKKVFQSARSLVIHVQRHIDNTNKQFICDTCGSLFSCKSILESHIQRVHVAERNFKCKVCAKDFLTRQNLKDHFLAVHTATRSFICEHCGAAFKLPRDVQNHVKRKHEKNNIYYCKETGCLKTFCTKKGFDNHMNIHLGKKPYVCTHCDKAFTCNSHLLRHLMLHSGATPYKCQLCGNKFTQAGNLKIHLKVHRDQLTEKERNDTFLEEKNRVSAVRNVKMKRNVYDISDVTDDMIFHEDMDEELKVSGKKNVKVPVHQPQTMNVQNQSHESEEMEANFVINPFTTADHFSSTQTNEWKSPIKLLGVKRVTNPSDLNMTEDKDIRAANNIHVLESPGVKTTNIVDRETFTILSEGKLTPADPVSPIESSEWNISLLNSGLIKSIESVKTLNKISECTEIVSKTISQGLNQPTLNPEFAPTDMDEQLDGVIETPPGLTSSDISKDPSIENNTKVTYELEGEMYVKKELEDDMNVKSEDNSKLDNTCNELSSMKSYYQDSADVNTIHVVKLSNCCAEHADDRDGFTSELESDVNISNSSIEPFERNDEMSNSLEPFPDKNLGTDEDLLGSSNMDGHLSSIESKESVIQPIKEEHVHVLENPLQKESNLTQYCGINISTTKMNLTHNNQHQINEKLTTIKSGEIIYKCDNCEKVYKNEKSLIRHQQKCTSKTATSLLHTDETESNSCFSCDQCDKIYRIKDSLSKHKREMHQVERFPCEHCGKILYSARRLKSHIASFCPSAQKQDIFPCDVCGKTFKFLCSLETHQQRHILQRERRFTCEFCGNSFITMYELTKHRNVVHFKIKPFVCKICESSFSSRESLKLHFITQHTEVKQFVCDVCGKEFQYQAGLKVHMKSHTDTLKTHSCGHCDKSFSRLAYLKRHMTMHNGTKIIECEICGAKFDKSKLARHLLVHSGEKPISCELCGKLFTQMGNLKIHLKVHRDVYSTMECEDVLNRAKVKAQELVKAKKRKIIVDVDTIDFTNEEICHPDQSYKKRTKLNYDENFVQSDKTYKCDVCDQTFYDPTNLRTHTMIHTGEKPYRCNVCGKAFSWSNSLRNHEKIHTGQR